MNKSQFEKISLIVIIIIILLIPTYLIKEKISGFNRDGSIEEKATFVGRETCKECHATEYNLWQGSHHDRAMDFANDSTVLGDFNNAELIDKSGITHKFYKKNEQFYVSTIGDDGTIKEYEIKYTFGFTPLQQYLIEFDGGRLQTLALTWNSLDNNWYHMADSVYKGQNIDHNNWLHWTNQAQNWNGMCADCHSTNLAKNYDYQTDSYHTTWSEIDVSCEACHGPSSKHLEWAKQPEYARDGYINLGLPVQTSNLDNKQYVNQCARCHTRRSSLGDYDMTNSDIYNHMIPQLPVEPLYYIDGQIKDEDYVFGSFTQSKMYMHDIKCNDCHNVHSGKRLFEGNDLCMQCHVGAIYDTPEHHFHKAAGEAGKAVTSVAGVKYDVGEGTKCINCHMHAQYFMGVDYRNDHSFRIPRPDLSEKLGSPNACNQCHANKTNQWAQGYIEKWYGKRKRYQYGEAFALGNKGTKEGFDALQAIYSNDLYPPIIRSTAIQQLGTNYQTESKNTLSEVLLNTDPMLRHTALRNLAIDSPESLNKILPLLNDESKAVRIDCANKLMGIPEDQIPENYRSILAQVNQEYLTSLQYNADFPIGKFGLANYYYNKKQYAEAEKFYLAALKQDEELHIIKINLAYLYNATGKPEKAEILFKDYLKYNPNDGEILFSYALLLADLKQYEASLNYLLKANKAAPENARIDYNIAMMYDFYNEKTKAITFLKQALKKQPNDISINMALLNYYYTNSKINEAKTLAKDMLIKFPNMENKAEIEELINN